MADGDIKGMCLVLRSCIQTLTCYETLEMRDGIPQAVEIYPEFRFPPPPPPPLPSTLLSMCFYTSITLSD